MQFISVQLPFESFFANNFNHLHSTSIKLIVRDPFVASTKRKSVGHTYGIGGYAEEYATLTCLVVNAVGQEHRP